MIRIPAFELPAPIARLVARLPQRPHSLAMAAALELAQRTGVLRAADLDVLEGRTVGMEARDAGIRAAVTRRGGRFVAAAPDDAQVTFRAPVSACLQILARQEDPDTLFFDRRLVVEGDTELGLVVKNLLDQVDFQALRLPGMRPAAR